MNTSLCIRHCKYFLNSSAAGKTEHRDLFSPMSVKFKTCKYVLPCLLSSHECDPQRVSAWSVLQIPEHSDSAGGRGGVEWHRQMLHKSGPVHKPPWISGLEKDEASTSQIAWQCPAHQVGGSIVSALLKEWPQQSRLLLASPGSPQNCRAPWLVPGCFPVHISGALILTKLGVHQESLPLNPWGNLSL